MTRHFRGNCFIAAFLVASSALQHSASALDLTLDEAHVLRLEADVGSIILGNPAIADVMLQNERLLIITPKSFGQTNLILLDKAGVEISETSLKVQSAGSPHISLFLGAKRETFLCSPVCESVVNPGDNAAIFRETMDGAVKKTELGRKAVDLKATPRD